MSIGEVAEATGLQTSTLRYYESIGLLPEPRRLNGRRRYNQSILSVLEVIHLAKECNFSLDEIRTVLYGPPEGESPSQRWKALAAAKLQETETLLASAQRQKAALTESITGEALHQELDQAIPSLIDETAEAPISA
jgi:MerR family redox-sensitive transcriptional activator SoxR